MEAENVAKLKIIHRSEMSEIEKIDYFFDSLEDLIGEFVESEFIEVGHSLIRLREARLHWNDFAHSEPD